MQTRTAEISGGVYVFLSGIFAGDCVVTNVSEAEAGATRLR